MSFTYFVKIKAPFGFACTQFGLLALTQELLALNRHLLALDHALLAPHWICLQVGTFLLLH